MKTIKTISMALLVLGGLFLFQVSKAAVSVDSEEQSFVDILNEYRKGLGLTELKLSNNVLAGSEFFAQNFSEHPNDSNVCVHIDSTGNAPEERGKKYGFYFLAENMGWGYSAGQDMFDGWKASSGHLANMTNSGARTIGIARYYNPNAVGKTDCRGNVIGSPWFWIADFSDEGVERLIGNNLKDSEMYTTPYRKMTFTVKKYSKKSHKYKAARWAEVKVYNKAGSRLIDHDIADKKGSCSVYMLGTGTTVTLKVASFKGKKTVKFTIGNKKSKNKSIKWTKNLKYAVKI